MLVKNTGFATSSASTMFWICGDVEAGGFPVQNAYKIAYGDENTTFEPWTFEPVNGYIILIISAVVVHIHPDSKKNRLKSNQECKDDNSQSRFWHFIVLWIHKKETQYKRDKNENSIKKGK